MIAFNILDQVNERNFPQKFKDDYLWKQIMYKLYNNKIMVQQENSLPVPMKSRKRSLESEGSILTFLIAILLFFWYLKLKD